MSHNITLLHYIKVSNTPIPSKVYAKTFIFFKHSIYFKSIIQYE